jgi:hypothetical protein
VSAALSEANQGYTPDPFGAVSLGASDLLSTGSEPPEWAVICFEGPMVAAGQVYDGDSEGFISRSDVRLLLAPRPEYVASQRFAADLRTRRGIVEFIVPSAPAFNAVPQAILWNHVLFGGNAGQFDPEDLPHGATIELVGFA